jgi:hypothetical protein
MSASEDKLPYKLINNIPVPQLQSRSDWPTWKEYIEKTSKICGVWEYCDPANTEDEYLEQTANLSEPTFRTVREDAWSITDLDDADFQKFRSLVKEYREKRDELDRKRKAIEAIGVLIHASVSKKFQTYLVGSTPYDKLTALSKAFSGPSPDEINEAASEWDALQQLAESPQIQEYLTRWKALFEKCLDMKMVKSSQEQALGKSLLDSQDQATMWKPLYFQRWFVHPEPYGWKMEKEDTIGLATWPAANTEIDDKSQNEDENDDISWTSDAVAHSDDEGEGGVDSWLL